MNRESKLWLFGAGGVVVVVVAVVLMFGLSSAPGFPDLYEDDGPTIEGMVAYVEYDLDTCVHVLDVATGESEETYCDQSLWLEGWDRDGHLRIQVDSGREGLLLVVDPATGEVLGSDNTPHDERPESDIPQPHHLPGMRTSSHDGHATLSYRQDGSEVVLIDVEGSRDYSFWDYGLTTDETYVWVCDSEERLLVVAADGSNGPWVVAEDVAEPVWRQ